MSASKNAGSPGHRFRNEALERETERINAEFQAVLVQHSKQREKLASRTDNLGMEKFYEIMGGFYECNLRKHASPTKRLMQQKEAAWKHKEFLAKKMGKPDAATYSLTYVASPEKTYVIQP